MDLQDTMKDCLRRGWKPTLSAYAQLEDPDDFESRNFNAPAYYAMIYAFVTKEPDGQPRLMGFDEEVPMEGRLMLARGDGDSPEEAMRLAFENARQEAAEFSRDPGRERRGEIIS